MFRSKTLFILGAGSSHEVGLPVGDGLKKAIADKIDIRFEDGFKQNSGDYQVMHAIREHAKIKGGPMANPNPYLHKAWMLRDALPQAISIDNLLDAHKNDEMAEACGKFGIVRSILDAEQSSKLFQSEYGKKIDFALSDDSWFAGFVKVLTEGVSKDQVNGIFENVSFINFNYDRCVQHYLFDALQNYYGMDANSIIPIMKTLNIVHPYGSVGNLQWYGPTVNRSVVPFGLKNGNVLEISKGIKTFNQQVDEGEEIKELRLSVQNAEIIVFLGFAFHRQNLDLLKPEGPCKAKKIFATAFGISHSDCGVIKGEIQELLAQEELKASIEMHNHLKCNDIFKQYLRSLTAKV